MIYTIVILFVLVIFLAVGWWREAELTNELTNLNDQLKQEARDVREDKRVLLLQLSSIVETTEKIKYE